MTDKFCETEREMEAGFKVFGWLELDQDCSNPFQDGMGMIRSLSHRHINSIDVEEAKELLKTDKMVVPLSYFEHGLSLWDVQGGSRFGSCPDKQWDGVSFAGVWIPDQCCRDNIKYLSHKKHITYKAAAYEMAKQCCETYTEWANGECYGYVVELRDENGTVIEEDSCWGYIGQKWAEQEMQSVVNGMKQPELAPQI